jgi:hypothetical protein
MNQKIEHAEGPSWSIEKRFVTFEEADARRVELLNDEPDLQVKVHWMGRTGNEFFAVKTRVNPEILQELEAQKRREEKKRRKAKLNKKRRKK